MQRAIADPRRCAGARSAARGRMSCGVIDATQTRNENRPKIGMLGAKHNPSVKSVEAVTRQRMSERGRAISPKGDSRKRPTAYLS
jgi:hypothetical protein